MKKSELMEAFMKFIASQDIGDYAEESANEKEEINFLELTPDKILALMLEKIMRAEQHEELTLKNTAEHMFDDSLVLTLKVSEDRVTFSLVKQ